MILLAIATAMVIQGPAPAAQSAAPKTVPIKEWKVPWDDTRPRDPYVAKDGRVWFVGQVGNYLAVLDTTTGQFKRYDLEPGAGPHNLIVDDNGTVWYTGNTAAHIGNLDPATGKITKYPMPDPAARDPHTLIFDRDYAQNGLMFFTVQGGGFVGRFNSKTGEVTLRKPATPSSRPYGIMQDSKGIVWFDEFNTNKIGRLDPATMELKEFPLPAEKARPRRIAVTNDGIVWYGDYARGYLGRLDPATGKVEEWLNPGGADSRPYALGTDGEKVWFAETGSDPNRLVGFDPRTRQFISVSNVPSGGGTVRHMFYDKRTESFWFGSDVGTIGRAAVSLKDKPVS
jgi:virginiamycin B lyase